jgi:hypothetical protein
VKWHLNFLNNLGIKCSGLVGFTETLVGSETPTDKQTLLRSTVEKGQKLPSRDFSLSKVDLTGGKGTGESH